MIPLESNNDAYLTLRVNDALVFDYQFGNQKVLVSLLCVIILGKYKSAFSRQLVDHFRAVYKKSDLFELILLSAGNRRLVICIRYYMIAYVLLFMYKFFCEKKKSSGHIPTSCSNNILRL